ncbi:hypothetical protein BASA50_002770 [Batrachochytrium salamandrivorans]|uniref:F-box domain-containing protein n=1 Tax=Batrachochytrium salamandrivorans TaxID=1357716 RepID=A0ABQ8FK84_9FUNG|nr:hypothetical protein BASA62_004210 [Batrachochytrium salamandrivorans]KAH6580582.1 hypothetical protein BASA61_009594 [Batrachochytrium salamandrivorans]KAH6582763.1 hypothetical protein BASA60_001775 [Batrachochytrium salamandrivorans]KAH6599745.1 hypothetical protein BASA50_002770 [Batrachochytrium salamandrivorans]KAH9274079.1 hypothetical protein BASA83_003722 [Batrachochytrium salamandrivorans]
MTILSTDLATDDSMPSLSSSRSSIASCMSSQYHQVLSSTVFHSSSSTAINSPTLSHSSTRRSSHIIHNTSSSDITALQRSPSEKSLNDSSSSSIRILGLSFGFSARLGSRNFGRLNSVAAGPKLCQELEALPNELLLIVFEFCATEVLLKVRLTSAKIHSLTNVVLSHRFKGPVAMLALTTTTLAANHRNLVAAKSPQLAHYSQFLATSSSTEITEVAWYASPPAELQTVCECLCILRGVIPAPTSNQIATGPGRVRTPWPTLRRIMSRYDFKSWLVNLKENYESIDIAHIRRIEDIIRMDALITYERMREVSLAGYRLLIVVAAALQSGIICNEIVTSKLELKTFDRKYERARRFLAAVNGKHLVPLLPTHDSASK